MNSTGLRLVVNGVNRGTVPPMLELSEGVNDLRLEHKSLGLVVQSTDIHLRLYNNICIEIDFSGFFMPKIKCRVKIIEGGNTNNGYRGAEPQPYQQPLPQPAPANRLKAGEVCPLCQRRNFMASDETCSSFCKWCGLVFDKDGYAKYTSWGNGESVVKYRPKNYFRNVWDASNVIKYDTTQLELNQRVLSYMFNNFSDCKIETRVSVHSFNPSAPEYSTPINFIVSQGDKKVAVLLVEFHKIGRYSLLETEEQCREHGITPIRLIVGMPNTEEYVVNRIREQLQ